MRVYNVLYLAGCVCIGIGVTIEMREMREQIRKSDEIWRLETQMSDTKESSSSPQSQPHSQS